MNRSHQWLMAAGASVLVLTNVVVLAGVALNRRQPPESVLALTEREFGPQWSWMWRDDENSGLGLRLLYRVETAQDSGSPSYDPFGPVAWLDEKRLAALGFRDTDYSRDLGRDVLLVMELDGPAHARVLRAAPDQETRQREEQKASRLFIVDAGLDQNTLRQRYPDRTRYAIVHGNIRPYQMRNRKVYGSVTAVRCETINVPLQFRGEIKKTFDIKVAFGSRLEPWILSAGAL